MTAVDEWPDVLDQATENDDQSDVGHVVPPRRRARVSRPPRQRRMRHRPTPPPGNYFPDVAAWVTEWLSEVYAHQVGHGEQFKWCSQWWRHAEAVTRLESAWKAWEALRLDPGTGASVWLRDHGDPCMAALTASQGPFAQCSADKHKGAPALPNDPPPPGLFTLGFQPGPCTGFETLSGLDSR